MSLYPFFSRQVLLPLADTYRRMRIGWNLKLLEEFQYESKSEIEECRNEKLRRLVTHAYENVPMYKELFDRLGLRPESIQKPKDLEKIPAVTKADFRKVFPQGCTAQNLPPRRGTLNSTSGSTGSPFQFYNDHQLYGAKMASKLLFFEWAHVNVGEKFVSIWGHHPTNIRANLWDGAIRRRKILSAYDLSTETIQSYITEINRYGPVNIMGYASSVLYLATLVKSAGLKITAPLRSVIVSAEALNFAQRKTVENNLGVPVFNVYGSREIGDVSGSCAEGHLHINDIGFIVQTDRKGRLLITDLDNFYMPFIRYDTGDLGKLGGTCTCGRNFSVMKELTGRSSDFVQVNGRTIPFLFFNYLFEQYGKFVTQFQVKQISKKELEILVVTTETFNEKVAAEISARIRTQSRGPVYVTPVKSIPVDKGGKRRLVLPL